jgi:hypothetical protein
MKPIARGPAILLLAALAVAAAGCPSPAPVDDVVEPEPDSLEVKVVSAESLPPVADYLPPLDGGRIAIAAPKGWSVMSRAEGYLTRFYKVNPSGLPRILITVEEYDSPTMKTATASNLGDFMALMDERVAGELIPGVSLIEPVRPMVLGENPFVRYVRPASLKGAAVERQILCTLVDGRLYTIDLQVLAGTLLQTRDDSYAVAAHMRFPKRGAGAPPPVTLPAPAVPPAAPMPPEPRPEPTP